MRFRTSRFFAAILLVASLLVSPVAFGGDRELREPRNPLERIVKIIKKIFVPVIHEDWPSPPKP